MATEVKTNVKKAIAKRTGHYEHLVVVGDHRLITDEPLSMESRATRPMIATISENMA